MIVSSVNDSGDKREFIFLFFVKSLVDYTLHLKIDFFFFFIFRCKQANIGRTV